MSVAPSYKQVLEILVNNNTNLLGLTATPGRAEILDDENIKLAEFFNRQKSTLKVKGYKSPIHYLESKGYLAKVENVRLEANINFSKIFTKSEIRSQLLRLQNGLDLSKEFIKKISSNEKRINMIIEAAIQESKKITNKILIFAGSIETAESIDKILKLENINSALITGETNHIERRYNIENLNRKTVN